MGGTRDTASVGFYGGVAPSQPPNSVFYSFLCGFHFFEKMFEIKVVERKIFYRMTYSYVSLGVMEELKTSSKVGKFTFLYLLLGIPLQNSTFQEKIGDKSCPVRHSPSTGISSSHVRLDLSLEAFTKEDNFVLPTIVYNPASNGKQNDKSGVLR